MIPNKKPEHDSHHQTKGNDSDKSAMLLVEVLEDHVFVGFESLAVMRPESHLEQIVSFHKVEQNLDASDEAIGAYNGMQEYKAEEILVIVQPDTLIDPNTVMVELLHAVATHGAVLRPRWFLNQACSALDPFFENDTVELKAFECVDDLTAVRVFVQFARIDPTRHEVACIADEHNQSADVQVIRIHSRIGYVRKSISDIDVEPTESACEVNDLHKWIVLIAYIVGHPVNQPDKLFPTYFARYCPRRIRQSLPKEYLHFGHTSAAPLVHTDEQVKKRDRK